jgi:hypothetical protein
MGCESEEFLRVEDTFRKYTVYNFAYGLSIVRYAYTAKSPG